MRQINTIVVHCSATRASQDIGAADIDRWHREGNGWSQIGYHYVVRRDGTVEPGRDIEKSGAHVRGHNSNSIGVCLVGGVAEDDVSVAEDNFTGKQWEALTGLLRNLLASYPKAVIVGHNELDSGKECPSFDVQVALHCGRLRDVLA